MRELEISHIYMNYHTITDETEALKDITFSVNKGDFISIVGPSGCGKSTLLNIIAGLISPSSGNVSINYNNDKETSVAMGYMFQKDHLFEWLSVWNNVLLGLKIKNKITDINKNNVEKLLKNYNLWEFRNHVPSQLSGGMRQRVALIRTLALNPQVLILDEPFSALDYQSRLKASDEIYKIIKRENKTALMVTHDISEAISNIRLLISIYW
ncbi:NitT/TauT family transport system ATP-binding protein [Clostridium grantii DSM 8605]|uniref:NitT/TauT family transport system ATP-binding protein n=1 Tax=Clostridium grantii DSM 8605 TaxID=1121316 RepID=A0A1M5WZ83_9CLOT|nr:NitT/TauT family transport system ATP-binding protein [Clostridium grantii DSM 8605]